MKVPKSSVDNDKPDAHPDAWARFERAVDAAVKSGPKHKAKANPKPPTPSGGGKTKRESK